MVGHVQRRSRVGCVVAGLILVVGCGSADPVTLETTPPTTQPPTTAATTTTTTTTEPATSSTTTNTTLPPTTVAPTLPPTTLEPLTEPLSPFLVERDETRFDIGTVEIPVIGVSQVLLEGVALKTLDHGVGHWPGTALPGHRGKVVIAGHRVSKKRPFYDVDKLVTGDEVIMTTGEGRFVYTVDRTAIIDPSQVEVIDQTDGHDGLLFACHPKGKTTHRIVVYLVLSSDPV